MVDMTGYSKNVHKSLFQRDLLLGVPTMGFVLILMLSSVFLYLFQWYFMIIPIVFIYVLMRYFTSRDPWLIEMMLDYVQQKDIFLP